MIMINVPDMHDSMSKVTLDGTVYWLRFTYNSTYDYWSIGIYDEDQNDYIPMTKIVPMYDLLRSYKSYEGIPQGYLFCAAKVEQIKESSFKDGDAIIVYIGAEE